MSDRTRTVIEKEIITQICFPINDVKKANANRGEVFEMFEAKIETVSPKVFQQRRSEIGVRSLHHIYYFPHGCYNYAPLRSS